METPLMNWVHELSRSPDWIAAAQAVKILFWLQVLDVAMGVVASLAQKRMDSTIGWKGFTRKIATMVIVAMVAVIDPLIPFDITVGAAIAYSGWEGLSIIEKAGMMGVPIPEFIKEALAKLRESQGDVKSVRIVETRVSQPVVIEQNMDEKPRRVVVVKEDGQDV